MKNLLYTMAIACLGITIYSTETNASEANTDFDPFEIGERQLPQSQLIPLIVKHFSPKIRTDIAYNKAVKLLRSYGLCWVRVYENSDTFDLKKNVLYLTHSNAKGLLAMNIKEVSLKKIYNSQDENFEHNKQCERFGRAIIKLAEALIRARQANYKLFITESRPKKGSRIRTESRTVSHRGFQF